tara:strand:+ start:4650 stop:5711 length:1062 start_codon:yes stop_codon:yes gene_type:complete
MINYLGKEEEKKLANALYYGGGAVGKAIGMSGLNESSLFGSKEDRENKEPLTDKQKETNSANLGAGLGLASAAISALDTDPEYGNADVAGSALQFASMGAAAGPIGAAVGGAVGLGVGLLTKDKKKREKRREESAKREKDQLSEDLKLQSERSIGYQEGGEIQMSNLGHIDYKPSIGYGAGFTGPSETEDIYFKSGTQRAPKGYFEESMARLEVKPETAIRLAQRYIDPAKMPDISMYSSSTRTPRPQINIASGQYDAYDVRMQKSGVEAGRVDDMSLGNYNTGGMTKGAYSHKTNPLAVVDKNGQHTGMELTGGEGVFDKPAMEKIKRMVAGGQFKEAGVFVNNEMKTWKHK